MRIHFLMLLLAVFLASAATAQAEQIRILDCEGCHLNAKCLDKNKEVIYWSGILHSADERFDLGDILTLSELTLKKGQKKGTRQRFQRPDPPAPIYRAIIREDKPTIGIKLIGSDL